jgi:hypothetical protein
MYDIDNMLVMKNYYILAQPLQYILMKILSDKSALLCRFQLIKRILSAPLQEHKQHLFVSIYIYETLADITPG